MSEYSVNNLNQYTSVSSMVNLSCDLNGNQLQRVVNGVTNYLAWDIQDRLTEIRDVESNLVARYYYDPFGRRLSKTVFSGASSNVTYFLYADEGLVAEFDEAGNEIRSYGYAPGSMWMNNPLYLQVSGLSTQVYFYLTDHLGAPQKLVDKNGAVVWSMVSESFGKTVVSPDSTVTNNLRFSSQYFDAESGLHYNTMRYYDPETGRYLGRDPVREREGLNHFCFVENRPLVNYDPNGEEPHREIELNKRKCRYYSRAEYEKWLADNKIILSPAQRFNLNLGCVGFTCQAQGNIPQPGADRAFPQNAPDTICWKAKDKNMALHRQCPKERPKRVAFIVQGRWAGEGAKEPKELPPDNHIPNDSIAKGLAWNYWTETSDRTWVTANASVFIEGGAIPSAPEIDPNRLARQFIRICSDPPETRIYQAEMWRATCMCKRGSDIPTPLP